MCRDEMKTLGVRILSEAAALRAAYLDGAALGELPVSDVPPGPADEPGATATLRAALRHLQAEMLLVRSGTAKTLVVLDDEAAIVGRLSGAGGASDLAAAG